MIKYTIDNIAEFARPVHGDKFKYLAVYRDGNRSQSYVDYECPEHGLLTSRISDHLKGYGCKYCSGRAITKEMFVAKATAVHGDLYDYSKVKINSVVDSVDIVCKRHGVFTQMAGSHLRGSGCKKCKGLFVNTEKFVNDARMAHGDKYDYSLAEYINAKTHVKIICKTHGVFEQIPRAHTAGKGCKFCSNSYHKTTAQFVEQARSIFGDRYDYSKTEYTYNNEKVIITCPEHGDFPKVAVAHLAGQGCPDCSHTAFSVLKPSVFYIYKTDKFVGFGISNRFKIRHKRHLTNISKAGVLFHSVEVFEMSGIVALDLETFVKRNFNGRILNTGIEGFKRESVAVDLYDELLSFVNEFIRGENVKENPKSRHRKRRTADLS